MSVFEAAHPGWLAALRGGLDKELAQAHAALLADPAKLDILDALRGIAGRGIDAGYFGLRDGRLIIPARDEHGTFTSLVSYQPDPAQRAADEQRDPALPKSIVPPGFGRGLIPPPESFLVGDEVHLVEGEPAMALLLSLDLNAVSFPGISGWQAAYPVRFQSRRVYVWTDHDAVGRRAANAICASLCGVAAEVRLVDAEPDLHDGTDIVDVFLGFRRQDGVDGASEYLRALARNAPIFGTVTLGDVDLTLLGGCVGEDLLDLTPPPPPDVITLFRRGDRVLLSGESGSGKSLLAAASVADVLADGGAALWVDADRQGRARSVRRVFGMLAARIGHDAAIRVFVNGRFVYVEALGGGAEHRAEATRLVRALVPDVVVLDALISAAADEGVKEGDNSALRSAFERPILNDVCCAADGPDPLRLLLAHLGKGIEPGDRHVRGFSAALDLSDQHVRIRSVTDALPDGTPGKYEIRSFKDRETYWPQDGRKIATMTVTRSEDDQHVAVDVAIVDPTAPGSQQPFRPTALMEKLNRYTESCSDRVPRSHLKTAVKGNAQAKEIALNLLLAEGYLDEVVGTSSRPKARMTGFVKPYRQAEDAAAGDAPPAIEPDDCSGCSDTVPPCSENTANARVPGVPPPYIGEHRELDHRARQAPASDAAVVHDGLGDETTDRCPRCAGPLVMTEFGSPVCKTACGMRSPS